MNTFVALLRGINVGGKNSLPMKSIVDLLDGMGMKGVKTYIQSGNVVFRSPRKSTSQIQKDVSKELDSICDFRPGLLILPLDEFEAIAKANPYPEGDEDPKSVHVFFLKEKSKNPALNRLEGLRFKTERFEFSENAVYLHAPDGIGRSKLAAGIESAMGVATTARNWRTVTKLLELAEGNH